LKNKVEGQEKKQIEYKNNRIQKWNGGGLTREALVTSSIDSIKTPIKFRINTPEKNRTRCIDIIRKLGQNSTAIRATRGRNQIVLFSSLEGLRPCAMVVQKKTK
jgi:hypothetical protein